MFAIPTIVDDEAGHIPDAEDMTDRNKAPAVHEAPRDTAGLGWMFWGSQSLPRAEHLIPFRN